MELFQTISYFSTLFENISEAIWIYTILLENTRDHLRALTLRLSKTIWQFLRLLGIGLHRAILDYIKLPLRMSAAMWHYLTPCDASLGCPKLSGAIWQFQSICHFLKLFELSWSQCSKLYGTIWGYARLSDISWFDIIWGHRRLLKSIRDYVKLFCTLSPYLILFEIIRNYMRLSHNIRSYNFPRLCDTLWDHISLSDTRDPRSVARLVAHSSLVARRSLALCCSSLANRSSHVARRP